MGHVTWPRSDPILGCTSCVWQGVCVGVVVGGVLVVPAAHVGQEGLRAGEERRFEGCDLLDSPVKWAQALT